MASKAKSSPPAKIKSRGRPKSTKAAVLTRRQELFVKSLSQKTARSLCGKLPLMLDTPQDQRTPEHMR